MKKNQSIYILTSTSYIHKRINIDNQIILNPKEYSSNIFVITVSLFTKSNFKLYRNKTLIN